jgi:hypothetical protein
MHIDDSLPGPRVARQAFRSYRKRGVKLELSLARDPADSAFHIRSSLTPDGLVRHIMARLIAHLTHISCTVNC